MVSDPLPTSWQRALARGVSQLEDQLDQWRLNARRHERRPVHITPYMGYAGPNTLHLVGRVLLERRIPAPTEEDSAWLNFINMARRFASLEVPNATLSVEFEGETLPLTANREGYFMLAHPLSAPLSPGAVWRPARVRLHDAPYIRRTLPANVEAAAPVLVPPSDARFAVVSDLDDTVLRTDVLNLTKMLRNTLLRNATTRLPFEGVAAFYRALRAADSGTYNPIFYVSSSPWNLYDVLVDFFRIRGIPRGPLFLRDIGVSEDHFFSSDHRSHKLLYIRQLLNAFPHLPFILIGDSGQHDAPTYLDAIRDVTQTRARRTEHMHALAAQARALGTPLLLVKDTVAAAEHAAQHGYINPAALDSIREERAHDEEPDDPIQRLLE